MPTLKSGLGVVGALMPIIYCGGLVYYFLDVSGSVEEAKTNGLGPTVMGLAVVGALFCIPLMVKLVRLFSGPRSPGGRNDPDTPTQEFDADAIVARYAAQQSSETVAAPRPTPAARGGASTTRPSFGRKVR